MSTELEVSQGEHTSVSDAPRKPSRKEALKAFARSAFRLLRPLLFMPVCALAVEVIFSVALWYPMSWRSVLLSLGIASIPASLIYLFRSARVKKVLQSVWLLLTTILYLSQYLYFRIFQTIYVAQSLKGAGKAMQFIEVVFTKIRQNFLWILLFFVPLALFVIFSRKVFESIPYRRRHGGIFLLCAVALTGLVLFSGYVDHTGATSTRFLMRNSFIPDESLKKFGLITTMGLDVKFNVFKISADDDTVIDMTDITIVTKPDDISPTAVPSPTPTTAPEATPTPAYTANELDIRFPTDASDETLADMNAYFSSREPTMKNAYTGMFKGKNLILITAESFSKYVIDPDLTPTLYKLSTEGFQFNHFYNPIWGVSTSDGEYVTTTGLIPEAGVWSYTKIADNLMPFAFGNQFSELGYTTRAYHDNTYTYYNRDKSYPTMGYLYKALGNGLDVKETWPESDVEMMQQSVGEYVNNAPFHVYYMTVSGHLEYNFFGNYIAKKNADAVKDLPYSDQVKAYLACQLELEYALENLMDQLEAAGQLDNTVIALGADHYPYGLDKSAYEELAGHALDGTFGLYENTFILWSADMKQPVTVDKYCSSLDIAPTLSNLFGLPYDSRLYMGTDILSTASPTVIFQDRSFINDKIMYNSDTMEVTLLTDESVSEDYIRDCIQDVSDRFKYSAKIIENDYYRYLMG